jgi:hypothetical protein
MLDKFTAFTAFLRQAMAAGLGHKAQPKGGYSYEKHNRHDSEPTPRLKTTGLLGQLRSMSFLPWEYLT